MSSEEDPSERKPLRQVIPQATFIQDVKGFVGARSVDDVIRELQEFMQKYKYVEQQIQKKKAKLLMKEPDIKRCLDAINLLIAKRDGDGDESDAASTTIDFALSDNIYARAKLSSSINSVNLWLGAGVMLEYPLDEAQSLLVS
jgi:nitrogen regulatory protein PII